jgi:hypothetical protein
MILDSKIPAGPISEKWSKHKFNLKLVNPANKRKFEVIVVGSGLAIFESIFLYWIYRNIIINHFLLFIQ